MDLSTLPNVPQSQMQSIDDLYEANPQRAGSRRQRADVLSLEMDTQTTVLYAPKLLKFYVSHRITRTEPQGRQVSEGTRIYGPSTAIRLLVLKLDEFYEARAITVFEDPRERIAELRAPYIMQIMIATGMRRWLCGG